MGKRATNLDRGEVADLDLFDDLADHVDEEHAALLDTIHGEGRDRRRRFTAKMRAVIFERDGARCFYCEARLASVGWHADHVIPWSRGGRTVVVNGVASCPRCNLRKSNKVW